MMNKESIDHEFVQRLNEAIEQSAINPAEEAAFKLAALHVDFKLPALLSELSKMEVPLQERTMESLKDNCAYNSITNAYTLQEDLRIELIGRMSPAEIKELISRMEVSAGNWRQALFNHMLNREISTWALLQPKEYIQAYTFCNWIKHPGIPLPPEAELLKLIRREDLLNPLRKLTVNFSGRAAYLEQIGKFVSPTRRDLPGPMANCLFITGVGGVGKSTLVNKFILDQHTGADNRNMPFVHIDFDNPDFSVSNVFALLREALSQLAIQNERFAPRFNELAKRISIEYSNTLNNNTSRGTDRGYFYQEINEGDRKMLSSLNTPVLVVFDSFEELQFRSSPAEIGVLFQFLTEINEIVPTLKSIFIGRSEIIDNKEPGEKIELNGFERESAVQFLKAFGLSDEALCNNIFDRFDGNPLTLLLAANLVIREMGSGTSTNEEVENKGIFNKIDKELFQQQLVARNLDHIHNKDLAAIAVPGLLLRKIDPDIIKHVLAEVCGLGQIDDDKALELYNDLKKETFLLKQSGNKVEFRKDLRVSLYDLIMKNPDYKAIQVHDAAVEYYREMPDPADQAEYLFHCLKRLDDIAIIDTVYQPAMKPYMETALSELPVEARVQLSRMMGIGTDTDSLEQLSTYRWELYMLAQIRNVLEFGDEKQLAETLQKLKKRTERTGNPDFTYFENLLNIRLMKEGAPVNTISQAGTALLKQDVEAAELRIGLLRTYELEFHKDYEKAFYMVESLVPDYSENNEAHWINHLPATKENISLLVDHYCVKKRILYRWGSDKKYNEDNTNRAIVNLLRALPETGRMSYIELIALFPKVYIEVMKRYYTRYYPSINLATKPAADSDTYRYQMLKVMEGSLAMFTEKEIFLNGQDFSGKYNYLKNNIKTGADLERYTRRAYKVFLKDFCLPGTPDICLFDFLLFAEALPRETKELELEKLTLTSDFSGKRNQAAVDDFINVSEVKACFERLDKAFSGKRKLVVSDVLDEEGHQYVNLVQRSSGVHHIALLGYTYILEKMGIRFLKIAGTNTGAINTAILGASGARNEENSTKLLDHLIKLDYFSLVDGPPLLRKLLMIFGTKGNFLNRMISLIAGIFMLVIMLLGIDVFLLSLLPNFKLSSVSSNIAIYSGVAVTSLLIIFLLFNLVLLFRRITTFGSGLNPGTVLFNWLKIILSSYDILNTTELQAKALQIPKLSVREGVDYNPELLTGDTVFICADVITQNRILFPANANLFWSDPGAVDPALFVRAAASSPFFFNSQVLKGINVADPAIKQAWIDAFGEYEPPSSACFVDGSMFSFFPISIFQDKNGTNAPLPTFGADTATSSVKINSRDISRLNWLGFFQRLLDTAKYNLEQDQVARGKALEKAVCRINIDKIAWLNYFLTDEEKLQLFTLGAKAATEFLINFDWEDYKRSLGTQHSLRL